MPFTIPDAFKEALKSNLTLNIALRMVCNDGTVLAWTNAEEDITLPELTIGPVTVPATLYTSGDCATPGSLQQTADPRQVDTWEFQAFFNEFLSQVDVARGLCHDARFTFIIFARENLTWQMLRESGVVGPHVLYRNYVVWTMKGLSSLLQADVLEVTSPLSRAKWGDPELAFFDLNGNTADGFAARVTGPVGSVDAEYPRRVFTLAATEGFPAGRFIDGTVTWFTGENMGLTAQVLNWEPSEGIFMLCKDAPREIATGDMVRAQIKAPLTFDEWMAFFGDGRYFAGEPQIPTIEKIAEVTRG